MIVSLKQKTVNNLMEREKSKDLLLTEMRDIIKQNRKGGKKWETRKQRRNGTAFVYRKI